MYIEVFNYLNYLKNKHNLYIFYDDELVEISLFTIGGGAAGIEFKPSNMSGQPIQMYIHTVCERYYLYTNVLFEKGLSICGSKKLNSKFPIGDIKYVIDLDSLNCCSMIDIVRNFYTGGDVYYSKKIDNDKINKIIKTAKNVKEQNTMKNNFSDIINMKMMMGIINNKGEIDLTKLMVLQSFAKDGNIEVTNIIKTKLTEKILKDTKSTEDLPLEKLALINMLDKGSLDLQEIIKYKMLSSDDIDIEKMMMMSCMTNGGDVTDIIKFKMMSQMLKEDTEQK